MAMTLGDFFSSAPYARPVNPRPITFTAVSKAGQNLPNGQPNPHKSAVAAQVTGVFAFMGGSGFEQARVAARKAIMERTTDKKTGVSYATEEDFWLESNYQMIFRSVFQWEPKQKIIGDRLFDNVDLARDLIEASEATRIVAEYNKYVKDEHPADKDANGEEAGVDQETFRGTQG